MPLWEYKILSSRQTPFASPQLLESFLNALGREQWEILSWHQTPGNPLEFDAILRRPIYREWHVDAPPPKPEESAVEEEVVDRRSGELREIVLPENALAEDDESIWDDEDEDRPETIFDAVKPFLRRNPQGQGSSASIEFLANKCGATAEELLNAFAEEGLHVPTDGARRSAVAEHGGQYYWLNQNQRGQIWLNSKPKPTQKMPGEDEETADDFTEAVVAPSLAEAPTQPPAPAAPEVQRTELLQLPAEELLERLRRLMRRNRRGAGYSGSVEYLARQVGVEVDALVTALGAAGLGVPATADDRLDAVPIGAYAYWLNKASNGQLWINGKERRPERTEDGSGGETLATGEAGHAPAVATDTTLPPAADAAAPEGEHPAVEGMTPEARRDADAPAVATGEDLVDAAALTDLERVHPAATVSLPPSDAVPEATGEGGPEGESDAAAHVADPLAEADVGISGEAVVDADPASDPVMDAEERDASADAAWLAGLRARLEKGGRRGELLAPVQDLAEQLGSTALDLIDRLAKAGIGQPGDGGERAALAVAEGWAYWLAYDNDVLHLHARERASLQAPRRSRGRSRRR